HPHRGHRRQLRELGTCPLRQRAEHRHGGHLHGHGDPPGGMIRALTALLIALLLAPGMAGPAEAADGRGRFGIRLMDAPVSRRNDPRAHYQIVDHLRPGATIRRRIQVSNDSAAPLRIAMGVSPAEIRENRFTVTDGAAANELPGWISFDPGSFEVPPYGRTVVRATIRVPDSAPEGERYGVIWAETGAPA